MAPMLILWGLIILAAMIAKYFVPLLILGVISSIGFVLFMMAAARIGRDQRAGKPLLIIGLILLFSPAAATIFELVRLWIAAQH